MSYLTDTGVHTRASLALRLNGLRDIPEHGDLILLIYPAKYLLIADGRNSAG